MTDASFLGVAQSVTGRRWVGPAASVERGGLAIAQATGLPEIVGRILASAGVTGEEAETYLTPRLRDLMPDPSTLADMDAAAQRLVAAIARRQRIAVFGDYDVDGACSVALLATWCRMQGAAITPYIPDRIDEGYGPNVPAMEDLARSHDLIICVDCGTLSHEPIAAARATGAEVAVIDHHLPGPDLPDALVVNPNRADDGSGLGHVCAAGVVFLLLVAANRLLRAEGRDGPDLMAMLDLVALATVADVAPMLGLNRAFVRQGLSVLARRQRPGLVALADVAGLTAPPTSRDLGFALGPRINAGGRIGASGLGADLLSTEDPHQAAALAERLDTLNRERREIESAVTEAAIDQIEARGEPGPLVWAAGPGWHPGVVGIVASRLKDRFNRPALCIGLNDETGQGSGRSVQGIDLGSAVAALARNGVLIKGGGHRMAAGLTVEPARVEEAMAALSDRISAQGIEATGPADLPLIGAMAPGGATLDLLENLEQAGPYGPSNPAPKVAISHAIPTGVRIVGTGHAQVRLTAGGAPPLGAIAFRAADNGIADALTAAASARQPVHAAGQLTLDDWGGRRRVKLQIDDVAIPS
ncbi:MAG: single-stranded-DNA-specific exonuclease RecJ [Pseudomonadota bacterium]